MLTNAATPVANSLFTVTLDFGPGILPVMPAGWRSECALRAARMPSPSYRLGNPAPVPYALHASTSGYATAVTGPIAASHITGTLASIKHRRRHNHRILAGFGAAMSNLDAGGQRRGFGRCGDVWRSDNNHLLNAGYLRLGSSTHLSVTEESWRNLASLPVNTTQPVEGREWHTGLDGE